MKPYHSSPSSGDVFNDGDNIRFAGVVSDSEDVPTDISLSWEVISMVSLAPPHRIHWKGEFSTIVL